jgi:hypothetical protein
MRKRLRTRVARADTLPTSCSAADAQVNSETVCYNLPALAPAKSDPQAVSRLAPKHLRIGWWSLLVFGCLGLILEGLHGFKVGAYLDVANDTRRLMWTLAHAHGTLLGLVHLGFAFSQPYLTGVAADRLRHASSSLLAASALLPGGFFLAGVRFYAGDPGLGIVLVPVGAALLLFAAFVAARGIGASDAEGRAPRTSSKKE